MRYDAAMNEQLISHIEELGLSNKEARVYVACLMAGPSAVQRIADQAGIKRVTTYVILESLVGLGLVSQSVKGKKTLFIAEDPTNLRRLLEKREQELREQTANFDSILPELAGLKTVPKESPNVKFVDSADGIRAIFATFYATYGKNGGEVLGISNLDQLHAFFPERGSGSPNPERTKNDLSSKFIYTSVDGPRYTAEEDRKANRTSLFITPGEYPIRGDITIVGEHVIMISLEGTRPIGITIRSQEIADSMKALFFLIWNSKK